MIKKRLLRSLKWLALFMIFVPLTVIAFIFERENSFRLPLTAGCGFIALLSIFASIYALFDRNIGKKSTMVIEDIFRLKNGSVVVGYIKGGMAVGEKVTITSKYRDDTIAKINDIEINRHKKKAAINTYAALYFKHVDADNLYKGDIVIYEQ